MEYLRSKDEPAHCVHEVLYDIFASFFAREVVVAEVEELDCLTSLDQVHYFNNLLGEKRDPRKTQIFYYFVGAEEHAEVVEEFAVVEANLLQVERNKFPVGLQSRE